MGYLLAVTAIFFWSWNIIVATGFASSLAPLEIAFGRWLVAACILLPLAWKRLAAGRKLLLKHAPLVVGLAVTGIDGFGFLMSCQEPIYGGKKKPQKVVEDILAKAVSAGSPSVTSTSMMR